MGTLGVQEMFVIFLLALVLFGPKKLPELGRTIGKALTEFRRASSDLKASFDREMQNLERENESLKEVTHNAAAEIYDHSNYSYAYEDQSLPVEESHQIPPATANPSTVSASEVPGAESHGTTAEPHGDSGEPERTLETASVAPAPHPPVEGTVPRSSAPDASQHS